MSGRRMSMSRSRSRTGRRSRSVSRTRSRSYGRPDIRRASSFKRGRLSGPISTSGKHCKVYGRARRDTLQKSSASFRLKVLNAIEEPKSIVNDFVGSITTTPSVFHTQKWDVNASFQIEDTKEAYKLCEIGLASVAQNVKPIMSYSKEITYTNQTTVSDVLYHAYRCKPRFDLDVALQPLLFITTNDTSSDPAPSVVPMYTSSIDHNDPNFTPYMCPAFTQHYKIVESKSGRLPPGDSFKLALNHKPKVLNGFMHFDDTGSNPGIWKDDTEFWIVRFYGDMALARSTLGTEGWKPEYPPFCLTFHVVEKITAKRHLTQSRNEQYLYRSGYAIDAFTPAAAQSINDESDVQGSIVVSI